MNFSITQLLLGIVLALIISILGKRAHALSTSGALGAVLLGTIIFGLGGLDWAVLMIAFFVSSSGLSKFLAKRKADLAEKFSKGSQRDIGQVMANGGISGLFVLIAIFSGEPTWAWMAFAGSLAAANADTWSTELGVLSRKTPRLITNGKKVEKGTSGGITLAGTLASLAGGFFIAIFAALLWPAPSENPFWGRMFILLAVSLSGLLGGMVDSLLGATIQAIYYCPQCKKETERYPEHTCGTNTNLLRGWKWLDNDWVNTICTLSGTLFAVLFCFLLFPGG